MADDESSLSRMFLGPAKKGDKMPSVQDVLDLFEKGFKAGQIRQELGLSKDQLGRARSILESARPEIYYFVVDRKPKLATAFLDANMPLGLVSFLSRAKGIAVWHVNYAGLKDKSDEDIYTEAIARGVDAIITFDNRNKSDKDLARIAENKVLEIWSDKSLGFDDMMRHLRLLPLIIRFKQPKEKSRDHVIGLMNLYEPQIRSFMRTPSTPYIDVAKEGVRSGPSFADIPAIEEKRVFVREDISRLEADAYALQGRMLSMKRFSGRSPEEIEKDKRDIRSRAFEVAEQIAENRRSVDILAERARFNGGRQLRADT